MGVKAIRHFNGPNLHSLKPALVVQVPALADGGPASPVDLPALLTGLIAQMHAIDPASRVTAVHGERAATSATTAGRVAALALLLQRWLGHEVSFFEHGPAARAGQTHETLVIEHRFVELALAAVSTAVELLAAAHPVPQPARQHALLAAFRQRHAGAELHHALRSAEARGVPWRRPVAGQPVFELGQGVKLRRVWRNFTPDTSHLGTVIATRKHWAAALFRAHGLPAPRNVVVGDAEAAVRAAASLGLPVVVKPERTDFGTAVSVKLSDDDAIRRAFRVARAHGPVLVEQMVAGDNHRLLVMHGRFVSAVRQTPAQVVGDGRHTVRELVERVNRTRTDSLSNQWKRITLDEQVDGVLRDQGLTLDDVPAAEREVRLRMASNLSVGGTMRNVTAQVHADNQALAVRAAAVAGLDVAGIDFITTDIARSHHEVGGAICEINPTPGFTMGEPPGLLERLYFEGLFPPGDPGRVPTVVVLVADTPDAGTAELLSALEGLLAARLAAGPPAVRVPGAVPVVGVGVGVGVGVPGMARVGSDVLVAGPRAEAADFAKVLADPRVGAGLLALTAESVARHGLPLDRCSVLLVTGGGAARQMTGPAAGLRQAVVRLLGRVADAVVLSADDPHRAALDTATVVHPLAAVDADGAPHGGLSVGALLQATRAALVD